ncbi:OmpA family protein [Hydrogenophaga sp.]|uniref:OmpA family protein n=1 Tax=Hydrogenophaga sp. TaxID=1904254 RepID=UPI0035647AAF
MSSNNEEPDHSIVAAVLITIVLLTIGLTAGVGLHSVRANAGKSTGVSTAMAAAEPAASASTTANTSASADASVVVENGVVRFYFASGNADLASGALDALGDAIAAATSGKRLVISGFHDATGDPVMNADLAKRRAMAVRDVLLGAGVNDDHVELKKPEVATGSGNDAEARRVEVVVTE